MRGIAWENDQKWFNRIQKHRTIKIFIQLGRMIPTPFLAHTPHIKKKGYQWDISEALVKKKTDTRKRSQGLAA